MDWFFRSRRRFSVAGSAAVIFLVQVLVPVATRAAPFAYVANYGEGSISVIDTANNALVATVLVGSFPSSLAVNPSGTRVYVDGTDLSIIDTTTNLVAKTLPAVGAPMAFDPSGSRLYMLAGGAQPTDPGQVIVLDTATNTVLAQIPVGLSPRGLAVAAGGMRVYVSNTFNDSESLSCGAPPPFNSNCILTLSVIDTATNTNIGFVQVDAYIRRVAATLTGGRVYVSSGKQVSVVDTGFNMVIAQIPGATDAIVVDPTGTRVYATTPNGVEVIDAVNNSVVATMDTRLPVDLAITPDGKRLYVTDGFASTISVVGTLAGTEVVTLPGAGIVIGPQNPPITPPPVPTETPTATLTSTPAPAGCAGDCNGDGSVTIDEIMRLVRIALGSAPLSDCSAGDVDHDGGITVDEIMAAANAALNGCGPRPTPTP